jgi:pimeloyl-ACP methyl ester carboxylesterase
MRERLIRGAGRPVVFLHAALSDGAQWEDLFAHVPPGVRTISLDIPAIAYDAQGTTPEMLERGLVEYLARLGGEPVTLVGHSVGGWLVGRVLGQLGARVQRAVIVAGVSYVPAEMRAAYERMAEALVNGALDRRVLEDQIATAAFAESSTPALAERLRAKLAAIPDARMVETFRLCAAIGETRVGAYDVPTTLLHAEDDSSAPLALGRQIAACGSRAELVVVPGGSHMLPWTHTELVAREALR